MQLKRQQYLACRTPRDRLLFCISAIEEGVIDIQTSVEDIRSLFGADFSDLGVTSGKGAALVSFETHPSVAQPTEPNAAVPSTMAKGWYLYLEYNARRQVTLYWLSDMQKGLTKSQQ